ncbi:helix-turn-helix transcriptional regulator [Dyella telluris]|uniref:Addiction module antidote protein, HigA family n=1 Tax=Dyella telluris TaxID=2763498 RepID=A0A7G8Q3T1_9GAMM|nr:hypothetical protein [Dyella telluris]QNK01439.1 hypothetical protein H8F01_20775 [Dyella telluris]
MRPNAVNASNLARRSGLPIWHIRRMLIGAPMHANDAVRLASALNTSALYWLVLQARYDLEQVLRESAPGVTVTKGWWRPSDLPDTSA